MAKTSLSEMPSYAGLHFILSQVEDNSHSIEEILDINDILDEDYQLERLEKEQEVVKTIINKLEENETA